MKRDMICEDIRIQIKVKLLNLSLCLVFHREKLRPSLPSAPSPTDCTKGLFWIHYVTTVSSLIMWDPPYNVWCLHFLMEPLGTEELFKTQRNCPSKGGLRKRVLPFGRKMVLPDAFTLPSHRDQSQPGPHALSSHRAPLHERRTLRSLQPGTLKQMLIVQG